MPLEAMEEVGKAVVNLGAAGLVLGLATAYVPLEDFELARQTAEAAIKMGAKALMVPSWCPQNHSRTIFWKSTLF